MVSGSLNGFIFCIDLALLISNGLDNSVVRE